MTNKQARKLWEDVLLNGTGNNTIKELGITQEKAKIFLSYTMPEIFVEDEINKLNKKKLKELKEKNKRMSNLLKKKKTSNMLLMVGLFSYFIIVIPILLLASYIKYLF